MSASPAAQAQIQRALAHIENAQAELGRAQSELSSLRNIGPTWKRCGKLYNSVHAYWYRVQNLANKRGRITTDSEPSP